MKKLIIALCSKLGLVARVTSKGTGINIFGFDAVLERQLSEDVVTFMTDVREMGKNVTFFPPSSENLAQGRGGCLYIGSNGLQSSSDEELDNAIDQM